MDILKAAHEWAKAEWLSNGFFVLFGVLFLLASIGFWQIGKTEAARAFVVPTLVAGGLLLILGGGLLFSTAKLSAGFDAAYAEDAAAFTASEAERAEKTMAQYATAVFKIMPMIVIAAAMLFLLTQGAIWRASSVTAIAMIAVIMLTDMNAHARMTEYRARLQAVDQTD